MNTDAVMVHVARVEAVLVRCGEICDLADRLKRDHVGLVRYSTELALRVLRDRVAEMRAVLRMCCESALTDTLVRVWLARGNDDAGVAWLAAREQGQRGPDGVWVDGVNGRSLVDFVAFAHRACRDTRRAICEQLELPAAESEG